MSQIRFKKSNQLILMVVHTMRLLACNLNPNQVQDTIDSCRHITTSWVLVNSWVKRRQLIKELHDFIHPAVGLNPLEATEFDFYECSDSSMHENIDDGPVYTSIFVSQDKADLQEQSYEIN